MIEYKEKIATLYKINKFLTSIDNLDSLLNLIMEEASLAVKAEASSVALYDKHKKNFYFSVALGEKGEQVKKIRIRPGEGIIGCVAQKRSPLNIADVSRDKRFSAKMDRHTGFKSKSILAVPIIHNKELIGVLEVINKRNAGCFSEQDVELLEIIAGQAGIAIENAKLYQRLDKKHKSLSRKHKQLIEAQQRLLLMERLSAVGKMAGCIVHDFVGPLSCIRGYAHFIKEAAADGKAGEWAANIIDSADKMVGMTKELLEFARGESGINIFEYMLEDFIEEIRGILSQELEKNNIRLMLELGYKGPVRMDKEKMQRVMFNLCFNARDALKDGGVIKIGTEIKKNQVIINVCDNGPGIPKQIRRDMFEPFVTYGKENGTGLGLAIVKKIVESHNGTISVKTRSPSKDSFTTMFTIKIPLKIVASDGGRSCLLKHDCR